MMFLFAYLASKSVPPGWPVHLIHLTEAAFVAVGFVCVLLAKSLKGTGKLWKRDMVAFVGGVSTSFGLIMPFEFAPFFFNVDGLWMMATMVLIPVYPIAAVLFIVLFRKSMNVSPNDSVSTRPPTSGRRPTEKDRRYPEIW